MLVGWLVGLLVALALLGVASLTWSSSPSVWGSLPLGRDHSKLILAVVLFTVIHLQNRTIQLALLSFAQMISEVSLLSFSVMSIFRCRVQFQMYGISR